MTTASTRQTWLLHPKLLFNLTYDHKTFGWTLCSHAAACLTWTCHGLDTLGESFTFDPFSFGYVKY